MEYIKIKDLFAEEGVQYRVPIYHRHYVWGKNSWERLWHNIIEQTERRLRNVNVRPHFMGFIAIHEQNETQEIVDGQQRLTTFQIILCAIRKACEYKENITNNIDERVNSLIFNSDPNQKYKLLPRERYNCKFFQYIAADEEDKLRDERPRYSPVKEAYDYFFNRIYNYIDNNEDVQNLFDSVLNDFVVIQMTVGSDDDPIQMCQDINGTGVSLDKFEFLKPILYHSTDTGTTRDELYREYWHHFEEDRLWIDTENTEHFLESFIMAKQSNYIYFNEDSISFQGIHRITKSNPFSLLDDEYVKNCGRYERNEKLNLFVEYHHYRRKLSEKLGMDRNDPQFVIHEFRELNKYALSYQEIRDPNSEIGFRLSFYADNEKSKRYISDGFENQMQYYVFYLENELDISKPLLTAFLNFMESLTVRYILCTAKKVSNKYSAGRRFHISIFDKLNDLLLESCLYLKTINCNISWCHPDDLDSEQDFGEFKTFPTDVVDESFRNCHYSFRQDAEVEVQYWGEFLAYLLYEIEFMIANENGIDKTEFDEMVGYVDHIYRRHPRTLTANVESTGTSLREECPGGIGNLTLCPRLWDTDDNSDDIPISESRIHYIHIPREWDINELRERVEKLVVYFNIRWQPLRDCIYEMIDAKGELIYTYEGRKELTHINVQDTTIEGVDTNSNQRVSLDTHNIIFSCASIMWNIVEPHIQVDEAIKAQELGPISPSTQKFQVNNRLLNTQESAVIVTRTGHVFCGEIKHFNADLICVKIRGISVILFQHNLLEFALTEEFTFEIKAFVPDAQRDDLGVLEFCDYRGGMGLAGFFEGSPRKFFVHISECPDNDFRSLQPGQKIKFTVVQTPYGMFVRNITPYSPEVNDHRYSGRRR